MYVERPSRLEVLRMKFTPATTCQLIANITDHRLYSPVLMRRIPYPLNLPMTRKTHPTKLPPTLTTGHMITPIDLLDPPTTPRPRTLLAHFI